MTGPATIDQALARGAAIITGNARAARRLQLDYGRRQRALGRTAWPTPLILDWRAWFDELWRQWSFNHPDAPTLLTTLQEVALWKTALGEDANFVVSPDSLASLAQQAYSLLCNYDAHVTRRESWESPDAERFRQWARTFDRACADRSWLSVSRMEERLTAAARDGELTLPPEIFLIGFDRITPAQQSFLNALKEYGILVESHDADSPQAPIRALAADGERAEIEACAHWLRKQLEANSEGRFAVLCTSVEQRRGEINRVFRRILTPEIEHSPDAPSPRSVYEFTLANPLVSVPVIHAAMLLLQWLVEPLPQEDVSTLLLSGYLAGNEDEHLACAHADDILRKQTSLTRLIPLTRVLVSNGMYAALPGPMRQRLQAALAFAGKSRFSEEHRLPSAWAELLRLALEATGWPGFRTADSVQFQAQHRWDKLLDDLALLDIATQPIPCTRFLHLLTLHAQQTLFAPESLDAPIQIMGPMESAGQSFDAVWLLGATDEQWPSTGRAHPLIPVRIQRATGMPHADVASDLDLAQAVTRRVLASTLHLTFSRARHNKDGELRLSPIVTALASEGNVPDTVTNSSDPADFLEPWQEPAPVPFPGGLTTGGAALLRDQAACPFRAFAAYRLRAEEISEPEWGLTAKDRGELLHDVLRRFWSETGPGPEPRRITTRDDLLQVIANGALVSTLEHHIAAAFQRKFSGNTVEPWLTAYIESEKRRLASLLTTWLTQEAQRQPFTVEACEQLLTGITVGSLQLNLRADRIDRFADGSHLLIDYKTGELKASAWQGDRPDEPQLPLYAVYGGVKDISGVLFAQIRNQDTKFIGNIRDARAQLTADLKDTSALVKFPYTDIMRDQWMTALTALADEFADGEARVEPKHGKDTCKYCPFPGLCRIHELSASAESDEEEQENEDA